LLLLLLLLLFCTRRYAATRGDAMKLRSMLQQGFNPDSADYDGRTALMLACVRGHRDVVDLLLSAGEEA
jgi:ankyrin repeat protein